MKAYMNRGILLMLFLIGSVAPSFAHHLALVVDKDNAVRDVSNADLAGILERQVKLWPNGKHVVLVLHRDPEHEVAVLQRLGNMPRERAEWLIAEHRREIRFVDSDAEELEAVHTIPGAVGMVDVRVITGDVNVVKVDGKLPLEKGYLLP